MGNTSSSDEVKFDGSGKIMKQMSFFGGLSNKEIDDDPELAALDKVARNRATIMKRIMKDSKGFKDNCGKQGYHEYKYSNGDNYHGQWKDDMKHGQGVYFSKTGNIFVGKFRYGKKHGLGISTVKSGTVYDGNYRNDKRSGKGKLTERSGAKYEGEFRKGLQHGYGVYTFPDGK